MDPAARIHIEQPSPPYCAACYQAKPGETHVDFGAATDGPMLPALEGTIGTVGHSVDDVIICAECIKAAGLLLGFGDIADLQRQLEEERATNDRLHEQLEGTRSSVTSALDVVKGIARGQLPAASTVINPALPLGRPAVSAPPKRRPRRS